MKGKKVPGEEKKEKEKKNRRKKNPHPTGPAFPRKAAPVLDFIFIMLKNI